MRGKPNKDLPCAVCEGTPTQLVRQRKPGTHGFFWNSFTGEYRLCESCYKRMESMKAVDGYRQKGREACTIVKAKTFEVLKATHKKAEA